MTTGTAPNTYAYFFANPTTLFVADANDGIQEWTLSGSTWSNVATLLGPGGAGTGYVGLTGVQTGNTVQLYATTGTMAANGTAANNSLISDLFTYTSGDSGIGTFGTAVTLATAGTDDTFAGVAFAPQAVAITPVVTISPSTTAGSPQTITVTATYASGPDMGDPDTSYTGTVSFSSSDSNAQVVLPGTYTFVSGDNGQHIFTNGVTLITAGSQTVTATDTSTGATSTGTVAVVGGRGHAVCRLGAGRRGGGRRLQRHRLGRRSIRQSGDELYRHCRHSAAAVPARHSPAVTPSSPATMARTPSAVSSCPRPPARPRAPANRSRPATPNSATGSATVDDYVVGNFTNGDLVVEQINATSNAVTPTGAASPVYLSEYQTTGSQSSAVETVPIWSSASSGSNNPLTLSGTAASEGALSLSSNGDYLVLAGYNTAAGGTTQGNSTVALVNGNGGVDTSTTTSLLSGNNTRAAASVDGTGVWVAGRRRDCLRSRWFLGRNARRCRLEWSRTHGRPLHRLADRRHSTVRLDGQDLSGRAKLHGGPAHPHAIHE